MKDKVKDAKLYKELKNKYGVKYKTKSIELKEILLDIAKNGPIELRAIAKKDYKIEPRIEKTGKLKSKAMLIKAISKVLSKTNNDSSIGKDVVIPFDMFRFGKYVRIISKINTLSAFYKRVQEYREKYLKEGYVLYLVTAYFNLREGEQGESPLHRNIRYSRYFTDEETLQEWFDTLKNSPNDIAEGSNGVDDDRYVPDFSHFDLKLNLHDQVGEGGSFTNKFFKTIELGKYKKGYCGYKCLQIALDEEITEEIYENEGLKSLQSMISYIEKKNLPIKIIGNYIRIDKAPSNDKWEIVMRGKWKMKIHKIEENEITVPVYHKCDNPTHIIIYDIEKQHYEITEKIELDNVYCDMSLMLYKKEEEEYTEMVKIKKNNDNLVEYGLVENLKYEVEFIIFDYETITAWDELNINKPYSLSILRCNIKDLQRLNLIESSHGYLKAISDKSDEEDVVNGLIDISCRLNGNLDCETYRREFIKTNGDVGIDKMKKIVTDEIKVALNNFINKHSTLFIGYDCTKQFLKYIEEHQSNKVFYFVSFNGSNFDNYILYSNCNKLSVDNLGAPLIANGQLLNFKLNGRHTMLDIRKHVGGSLLANCESFKIDLCKKIEGFSHYEMQKKYDNGELDEFIKTSEELKSYNTYDCLSLALIFYRYKIAIESIPGFSSYFVESYLTIGMLVNQKFNDHLTAENIQLPSFSVSKTKYLQSNKPSADKDKIKLEKECDDLNKRYLQYYNDISKNRIAGRVELFNGRQKIEENIASPDVCSLYPYSMCVAPVYYPTGKIIEVDTYADKPEDLIGYFYCDIDQTNMSVNIMAEKSKLGNNWEANIINNVFISSIMIDYLKKCGANVNTRNGIYFTGKKKGCKLFEFLLEVMKLKNIQDTLKENNSPDYNQVMREIYKLILNIPSGKLNQKLNREERKVVNSHEFLELQQNGKISKINAIMLVGDKAHVTFEKDEIDCIANGKPICVGALIYDYSKIYMHENMYSRVDRDRLIYTDTDKLRQSDFAKWCEYAEKQPVPHWQEVEKYDERYKTHMMYNEKTKVFGSFEDEYKGNKNNLSYFEQKKTYLCTDSTLNTRIKDMKFESEKDKKKYIKKYTSFHFKGISQSDVIIQDNDEDVDNMTSEELNEFFHSDGVKRISDDYVGFFEKLHTEKTAKILTCSLQRISNNLKKNTTMEQKDRMNNKCYNIVTSYRVKKITIQ